MKLSFGLTVKVFVIRSGQYQMVKIVTYEQINYKNIHIFMLCYWRNNIVNVFIDYIEKLTKEAILTFFCLQ